MSVLLILTTILGWTFSARILVINAVSSKSHKFAVMPILEELAQRGHQITVVSPFKPSKPVKNIQEIAVKELEDFIEITNVDWFAMTKAGPTQIIQIMSNTNAWISKSHEIVMKNKEFLIILKERKIDLIIFNGLFNEFSLKICNHLKVMMK